MEVWGENPPTFPQGGDWDFFKNDEKIIGGDSSKSLDKKRAWLKKIQFKPPFFNPGYTLHSMYNWEGAYIAG